MKIIASALAAIMIASCAAAQNLSPSDIVERAVTRVIVPGYEALAGEAESTRQTLGSLCAEPSAAHMKGARTAFARLVHAFGRIELIRFGPVIAENRIDRLFFWPDRRGIGLRQVQAALADEDESAANADTLAQKSVALQGLGALEFILHGTGGDDLATAGPESYRCRFGRAVSQRILITAGEILRGWAGPDGMARSITHPAADNPLYRTERESLEEIFGALAHGFEAIRDVKLLPILGRNGGEPNPRLAILRRSDLTFDILAANFEGLLHLFKDSGMGGLLAEDRRSAANSLRFEFDNTAHALSGLAPPVESSIESDEGLGRLRYLVILTRSLNRIAVNQIGPALGLTAGFSSLDGD